MTDQAFWLTRWEEGNIGWHEATGNKLLREWWQAPVVRRRVLVPLCGKTPDLLWLARRGHSVTGVELSPVAAAAFFDELDIPFERSAEGAFEIFRARDQDIEICCGDYFEFDRGPFDALYDRASLIALPQATRPAYAEHTRSLVAEDAWQLLITLHYDQARVAGPPFSVGPEEVARYWPDLVAAHRFEAIDEVPPKFREAGLESVRGAVWLRPEAGEAC